MPKSVIFLSYDGIDIIVNNIRQYSANTASTAVLLYIQLTTTTYNTARPCFWNCCCLLLLCQTSTHCKTVQYKFSVVDLMPARPKTLSQRDPHHNNLHHPKSGPLPYTAKATNSPRLSRRSHAPPVEESPPYRLKERRRCVVECGQCVYSQRRDRASLGSGGLPSERGRRARLKTLTRRACFGLFGNERALSTPIGNEVSCRY